MSHRISVYLWTTYQTMHIYLWAIKALLFTSISQQEDWIFTMWLLFFQKKDTPCDLCVKKHPLTCKHIWRDIQNPIYQKLERSCISSFCESSFTSFFRQPRLWKSGPLTMGRTCCWGTSEWNELKDNCWWRCTRNSDLFSPVEVGERWSYETYDGLKTENNPGGWPCFFCF